MIIDIHSHIIPYVDDGAQDWEMSMELVKSAESQGIIAMVATPHILAESDYERIERKIIANYLELTKKISKQNINIKIYLGCEIYAQPNMTLNHAISTFNNNKKYFLTELPMSEIPRFVAQKYFNFLLDGKIPIIAHPERNVGFQRKPEFIYEFVHRGVLMQINASSILGKYGDQAKQTAFTMLDHNLVHFVASDGHNNEHRSIRLREIYEIVKNNYGTIKAEQLFYTNPKIAIDGQALVNDAEPIPIEKKIKKSFWDRLKR
ncbi:hypothetical protein JXB12_08090 [candidate division KSB1 bacterium]|nr:hypothetical protein [candidate division KSB1 bacterium]